MDAVLVYDEVGTKADAAAATGSVHAKMAHIIETFADRVAYASNTLQASADTERSKYNDTTNTKIKEIIANLNGMMRVSFDMRRGTSGAGVKGRIYINGVAVGTERSTSAATYSTYTEDIAVAPGDLIQLYCQGASGDYVYVRNFRVYFEVRNTPAVSID